MRKVLNISESDHWRDYAEYIAPQHPQPDFKPGFKFNWNMFASGLVGGLIWLALIAFGKMVWLEFFSK